MSPYCTLLRAMTCEKVEAKEKGGSQEWSLGNLLIVMFEKSKISSLSKRSAFSISASSVFK